jgi:gas vesicle protein
MHKGVIILVKAVGDIDAKSQAEEFLESYEGKVWDWYAIGGRWQGTLSPFLNKFNKEAKKILKKTKGKGQTQADIESKKLELQALWESIGASGNNPYSDHYHNENSPYDVMPLKDCLKIVKEWSFNSLEKGKKMEEEAKTWLTDLNNEGKPKNNYDMYGHSIKNAGEIYSQQFCFDCNVYNVETGDYSIPENIEEYYAVMVDMHN